MMKVDKSQVTKLAEFRTLTLTGCEGIARITLDRPKARNAIDDQMRADLKNAVDIISCDENVRGVILTGRGQAFCAGGDIRGMQERLDQGPRAGEIGWRRQREFHGTLEKLFQLDRPTLAAVNGPAVGLGLDLALTCDFVWFSAAASASSSFIHRGLVPDGGGMFHLPRRVGLSKSKELVFSGRRVSANEALELGLADRVVESEDLVGTAQSWMEGLGTMPAVAQGFAKAVLNGSLESTLTEVNALASQAQAYCYSSPDHQESVREFLTARRAAKERAARDSHELSKETP